MNLSRLMRDEDNHVTGTLKEHLDAYTAGEYDGTEDASEFHAELRRFGYDVSEQEAREYLACLRQDSPS